MEDKDVFDRIAKVWWSLWGKSATSRPASREITGIPFWVIVRVDLDPGLRVVEAREQGVPEEAVGYYRTFGVTAASAEEACRLAMPELSPAGTVNWAETTAKPVDPESLAPEIRKRSGDWSVPGIWYRGGRVFFKS